MSLESLSDAVHRLEIEHDKLKAQTQKDMKSITRFNEAATKNAQSQTRFNQKTTNDVHEIKETTSEIKYTMLDMEDDVMRNYTEMADDIQKLTKKIDTIDIFPDLSGFLDVELPWPEYWDVSKNIMDRVPECCVCFANPRRVKWNSCKHAVLCMSCVKTITKGPVPFCPICRAEYTGHTLIRWKTTGKDWDQAMPHIKDHQHFLMGSQAVGVASDHEETRRDRYHDLLV